MSRFIALLLTFCALNAQSPFGGGSSDTPEIRSISEADSFRKSTLQALQVAQNPLHIKQDKASQAEIDAYTSAVKKVSAFKAWIAGSSSCPVSLKSDAARSLSNRRAFSKAIWDINDAPLKTEPPFSRKDIGVAVKLMNDARDIFQLPIEFSSCSLPDRNQ